MGLPTIDLTPLRKAHALLSEAVLFWNAQPEGTALKPHLRSAVIQSLDAQRWREWREMRNATGHAYDEAKAQAVALRAAAFAADASILLRALEANLAN